MVTLETCAQKCAPKVSGEGSVGCHVTATTEAPALHMMDHVTVTQDGLGVDAKKHAPKGSGEKAVVSDAYVRMVETVTP